MRPWDFWRHRMADGCLLAWRASVASQKQDSSGSSAFVAPFKQEEQLETWELWEDVTSDVIYSMLEIWFRLFGGIRTTPLWRHKVWTNLGRSTGFQVHLCARQCIYLLFNCTMRFYVLSPAMCRSPSAFINHFLDPEVLPSHFQGSLTRWTLTTCCLQCCHGCKKILRNCFMTNLVESSCNLILWSLFDSRLFWVVTQRHTVFFARNSRRGVDRRASFRHDRQFICAKTSNTFKYPILIHILIHITSLIIFYCH